MVTEVTSRKSKESLVLNRQSTPSMRGTKFPLLSLFLINNMRDTSFTVASLFASGVFS